VEDTEVGQTPYLGVDPDCHLRLTAAFIRLKNPADAADFFCSFRAQTMNSRPTNNNF
jgi:hypothetical protein